MDCDDYEALPSSTGMTTHMCAGALAGVMEHAVMYPVDSVKVRMQCLQPCPEARYRNVFHAFSQIVQTEGAGRTVRGIQAMIGGAGPAHALYFACYEKLKTVLHGANPGHHIIANGTAGCVATLLHDAVMNPAEVVKTRLQMYNSPYRGMLDCIVRTLRTEGLRAFYRSYTTQLTMNIPFQSLHFVTYELMQDLTNPTRVYSPYTHSASGAIAGGVAAAITTPLDVCKTLLNSQEDCVCRTRPVNSLSQAFMTVYEIRGLRGFVAGMSARVIYQMPSTAICWSIYEFFKYFITKHQLLEGNASNDSYISLSRAAAAAAAGSGSGSDLERMNSVPGSSTTNVTEWPTCTTPAVVDWPRPLTKSVTQVDTTTP